MSSIFVLAAATKFKIDLNRNDLNDLDESTIKQFQMNKNLHEAFENFKKDSTLGFIDYEKFQEEAKMYLSEMKKYKAKHQLILKKKRNSYSLSKDI